MFAVMAEAITRGLAVSGRSRPVSNRRHAAYPEQRDHRPGNVHPDVDDRRIAPAHARLMKLVRDRVLICVANVIQVAIAVPATIALVPAYGLPGAAVAQLGGRFTGRLFAALALARSVPTIAIQPGAVARADARTLGLFALPVLAIGISTQLGVGVDPIIVAVAAGPAAVGLYAAGSSLVRYGAFLLFPIVAVLLPSFSELGYSRPAEVAGVVLRCVRMAAAIGVIAFGSVAVRARRSSSSGSAGPTA